MGFILLDRKNKLKLLVSIRCATENIEGNMVNTTLSINTCKAKSLCINMSGIWT